MLLANVPDQCQLIMQSLREDQVLLVQETQKANVDNYIPANKQLAWLTNTAHEGTMGKRNTYLRAT